jgi:hypothetical protein
MPQPSAFENLFKLEQHLGASWPQFHVARDRTISVHERITSATDGLTDGDASFVIFGSLGRFEVTSDSDIDWTYLVDGQADLKHQSAALRVHSRVSDIQREPGPEGTFGSLAFSHDIVQHIGGQDDSNANLTRRILLLLESQPIGRREAYDRVLKVVLERYLTGDHGWIRGRTPHGVPRFILNDIVRYWRTIAVDFAYKQWTRDGRGWALRSAKLRLSRKLIYAAGLLYCLSLAEMDWSADPRVSQSDRKIRGIEHLFRLAGLTPLDLLAQAFLSSASLRDAAAAVFGSYNEFLELLSDASRRKHLGALTSEQAETDGQWERVRELGKTFQAGLDQLFLRDRSTRYPELIEAYGVF